MAGSSMTFSYDGDPDIRESLRGMNVITATWTSDDATGAVSGTTKKIAGMLNKGVTDPGAAAPTASYDIVITDTSGADVLADCVDDLVDRHTANTETVIFASTEGVMPGAVGPLTIAITNAGNAKNGVIYLYWRAG